MSEQPSFSLFNNELTNKPANKNFSYLNELNNIQRAAVETTKGPVMIIAGPGSGKTRVLTYRIAHLINQGNAPYRILALTFTNKAAREMKERIQQIVGIEAASQLWMGTFHSVFARILRIEADRIGYPRDFAIYDTQDSRSLLKSIVKEQNLNAEKYKPNVVHNQISRAKNDLMAPSVYQNNPLITERNEARGLKYIGKIYEIYMKRCQQAGAMDFDDLLVKMYFLLAKYPEALQKYQQKYNYIMIDEFQDTNIAQYNIVKKLVGNHQNICVVGDDAQSIYAFRGATINNILNFKRDYPTVQTFKLEQNYRSTKQIVHIANAVIGHNQNQIAKQIWTQNEEGNKTTLLVAPTDSDEGKLIAESIVVQGLRNHFRHKDFAILYRTNAQSRILEDALRKRNIPYRVYGGLSFYQRKEIKDMMAYLRLTVNQKDEEALKRIINYPKRGIGKATIDKVTKTAAQYECSIWEILINIRKFSLAKRTQQSILNFVKLILNFKNRLGKEDAYTLTKYIGKMSGITKALHQDKTVEGISRFENLEALLNGIKEFVDQAREAESVNPSEPADDSLGQYLQQVSLLTGMDEETEGDDYVTLMTIHAAKGLEFPYVYIVGLEEGLFPSKRSVNKITELEEERRLFYVAVTRAQKGLTLAYATSRYNFGSLQYSEMSRFVSEIPSEHLKVLGRKPPKFRHHSAINQSKENINIKNNIRQNINTAQKIHNKKDTSKFIAPNITFKASSSAKIVAGKKVLHQRFGPGIVTSVEGVGDKRMAIINFEAHNNKRMMLRFAKLMVLD